MINIKPPSPEDSDGERKKKNWKIEPRRLKSNNDRNLSRLDNLDEDDDYGGNTLGINKFVSKRSMDSKVSKVSSRRSRRDSKDSNSSNKSKNKGSGSGGLDKLQNYIKRSISKTSDKSNLLIQQALRNARKERVKIEKKSKYSNAETKAYSAIKTLPVLAQKNTLSSSGTDNTLNSKATMVD
jgi:hypothetical protein